MENSESMYVLPFFVAMLPGISRSELGGVTVTLCTRSRLLLLSEIGIALHEIGRACSKEGEGCIRFSHYIGSTEGDAGDILRFMCTLSISDCRAARCDGG